MCTISLSVSCFVLETRRKKIGVGNLDLGFSTCFSLLLKEEEEEDKEEEKRTTAKAAKAFRFSSLFFFVGRCVRVLERERERERERALFGFPSSSFVL